jgi:low affinity Fe/Cu permease
MTLNERFSKFSRDCALMLGSPLLFVANCLLIVIWLIAGPIYQFSDTWQLLVNTVTTVLTYLAVFILQNTQNRDSRAMHFKLDELIRSVKGARNSLVNLEELSDEELQKLEQQFKRVAEQAATRRKHKLASTDPTPTK